MYFVKTAMSLAALASSALAQLQLTSINLPTANSSVTPGSNITVQIGMQDYVDNIENLVLVIGLSECYNGYCASASLGLGSILYDGPYNPTGYSFTYYNYYQNFTVTIPASFPAGPASLAVLNLYAVGAEYEPNTEYLNLNVTVV